MSFIEYARSNYTHTQHQTLERGFGNVSKLESVPGDTNDSMVSPLRAELYGETAIVVGGLVNVLAASQIVESYDSSTAMIMAGTTALIGAAAVIKQRAGEAINAVI